MPASYAFDVTTGVASMASGGEQAVGGLFSDFGRDRDTTCHAQVSDILFTGGDPMIMKTNMCDLRVLRCCGAFTSLDGLVAVSRCRGWFLVQI